MTTYWPTGMPRAINPPRVRAGDICLAAAELWPARVAVVDGESSLDHTELRDHAVRLAHGLRESGIREGDVVMLHLPNCLWFLVGYYGALLAGATVSPTNPLQPVSVLREQLRSTAAAAVLTHPSQATTLLEAAAGTSLRRMIVVPATAAAPAADQTPADARLIPLTELLDGQPLDPPSLTTNVEAPAHLAFTGGTTGVSKCVDVGHHNVVANIAQQTHWRFGHEIVTGSGSAVASLRAIASMPDAVLHPGEETTVMVSPQFHAQALINSGLMVLTGTTMVLPGRFSREVLLDQVERYGATYLSGNPTMFAGILDSPTLSERNLTSLKALTSGAAPMDQRTFSRLAQAFPNAVVTEGYGLTEATCLVTSGPMQATALRKQGSVGLPIASTEVQVRDGDEAVGPGVHGRLWIRGPQVTDGYRDAPEATASQFVNGWLDSGDVGYLDGDGFVFITDRAKEMLIYKGYNVYPRELEEVLSAHPGVHRAAVVGRDDGAVGQVPHAFVVPASAEQFDIAELLEFVASRVPPYKRVRGVTVIDALPVSAKGEILKNELRAQLAD